MAAAWAAKLGNWEGNNESFRGARDKRWDLRFSVRGSRGGWGALLLPEYK